MATYLIECSTAMNMQFTSLQSPVRVKPTLFICCTLPLQVLGVKGRAQGSQPYVGEKLTGCSCSLRC
jgi:hypothetical protein